MKHCFLHGFLLLTFALQAIPVDEPLPDIVKLHQAFQADPENNETAWDRAMEKLNARIERQIFRPDETYRKLEATLEAARHALAKAKKNAQTAPRVIELGKKYAAVTQELKGLSPDDNRGREIDLKRRELTSLSRRLNFEISANSEVKKAQKELNDAESALGGHSRLLIERSALPVAKVFRDAVALSESVEKRGKVRFAGCYQIVGNPYKDLFKDIPPEKIDENTEAFYQYLRGVLKRENPDVDQAKIDAYVKMRANLLPRMPGDGKEALKASEVPLEELFNAMTAFHAQSADLNATVRRIRTAILKMPRNSFTRYEAFRMLANLPDDAAATKNRRVTAKNEAAKLIASGQLNDAAAPYVYNFYAYQATKDDWLELEKKLETLENANPWFRQMAIGRAAMVKAWRARGGGYAYTVSTDGWRGFKEEFEKARNAFLEAARLRPDLSQPYAELVEIEAGCGTVEQRIEMFKKTVKIDPTNTDAYTNVSWFTLPRWGGSHELILQLADEVLAYPHYKTVIPAYGFDLMARVVRDYPDYRWKNVYLRDGVVENGDRLFAERLKVENRPRWKTFALYHRALFEMATLRYDKAAATVAELGGEAAFNDLFKENYWRGAGMTGWFPRVPSEGTVTPVLLRVFTGKHGETLRALEKRYLDGDDEARDELAGLIRRETFAPEEKDTLIDLFGRWGIDEGLADYFSSQGPVNSFQVAGKEGYGHILEEMLSLGFNYGKYENYPGETAILIAENGTNPELLDLLKKAGDPLNRPEPRNGRAPMHVAAFEPNAIMIKKLLELGVSPTAPDRENHTPVQMAAARRGVEATMLLLKAGADVDVRDNDGDTALMFVMEQNSPRPIWEALIRHSKDLNIANNSGQTALHYAARLANDPAVVKAMLAAKADPGKADNSNKTPIDLAKERGKADFVKLMEEAK